MRPRRNRARPRIGNEYARPGTLGGKTYKARSRQHMNA